MNNIYNSENNFVVDNKKEEEPLALLNLEIEKGVIKQIKLYKNSNPEEVSFAFCKENNIDFSLMNHIKNEIETLMQKYFESIQKETDLNNNISDNNNKVQENNNNYNNNNYNGILNNDEYNSYKFINQSKNNINNNNQKNRRNLFFYQFLQNEKNQNKKMYLNKSNSANKYKIRLLNTLNNNKRRFKKDSQFPGGSSLRYINDSYLTHNFTTINNNLNLNIFDRLYNDAKIKRVVYKRPCHYCSQIKKNKIFEDNISSVYETINGKTINKMNLDMKPSYIRSYQIRPHQLLSKECSFQPNSFKIKPNYLNTIDTYHLNSTHYSNNFHDEKSSNKNLKTNELFKNIFNENYLNNNLKINQTKNNVLYEESYVPLKNKTKYFSNIDDNIEMLSLKAFNNLFNLLTNNDQSQLLNKNTININNIDNNSISILSQMIQDINNNELELNFDNFLKRIFNEISNEDKKFLVLNYSNAASNNSIQNNDISQKFRNIKNSSNYGYNNYNKNKSNKNSENNSRTSTNNNFHKKYRLTSGTEKKKNFYYL